MATAKTRPPVKRETYVGGGSRDDGGVPEPTNRLDVFDFGDKQVIPTGPLFNQTIRNLISNIFGSVLANAASGADQKGIFDSFMPKTLKIMGVPAGTPKGVGTPRQPTPQPTPTPGTPQPPSAPLPPGNNPGNLPGNPNKPNTPATDPSKNPLLTGGMSPIAEILKQVGTGSPQGYTPENLKYGDVSKGSAPGATLTPEQVNAMAKRVVQWQDPSGMWRGEDSSMGANRLIQMLSGNYDGGYRPEAPKSIWDQLLNDDRGNVVASAQGYTDKSYDPLRAFLETVLPKGGTTQNSNMQGLQAQPAVQDTAVPTNQPLVNTQQPAPTPQPTPVSPPLQTQAAAPNVQQAEQFKAMLSQFLSPYGSGAPAPGMARLDSNQLLDMKGLSAILGNGVLENRGTGYNPNLVLGGSGIGNSSAQLKQLLGNYKINTASPFGVDDAAAIMAIAQGVMSMGKGIFGKDQPLEHGTLINPDTIPFQPMFNDNSNSLAAFMQMLRDAAPGQNAMRPGASPLQGADLMQNDTMGSLLSSFSLPSFTGDYMSGTNVGDGIGDLGGVQSSFRGGFAANNVGGAEYSLPSLSSYRGPMSADGINSNGLGQSNSSYNGPLTSMSTPLQRQSTNFADEYLRSNPFAKTNEVGGALSEMLTGGMRFDTSPQMDAWSNVNKMRLNESMAQNNEMFGAHGLRFGTDLARANADLSSKYLAEESLQRGQIAQSAWENAANRRMQAIPLGEQLLSQRLGNLTQGYMLGNDERQYQEQGINRGLALGEADRASSEAAKGRQLNVLDLNRMIQESGIQRGFQMGEGDRAAGDAAKARGMTIQDMNRQSQESGISRQMQQAEADRMARERGIDRQLQTQGAGQAADERGIQRMMAEFARTQGALFPLLLQFALAGTEGDNIILEPQEEE